MAALTMAMLPDDAEHCDDVMDGCTVMQAFGSKSFCSSLGRDLAEMPEAGEWLVEVKLHGARIGPGSQVSGPSWALVAFQSGWRFVR